MEQIRRLRFSPKEAAEALGISKSKLYQHINAGEIAGYIIDNRRWFTPAHLETFLKRQAEKAGESQS